MLYPSILLLASAGVVIAQLPTAHLPAACESFANATELLQDDDGKVYCSSILSLGTVTNTLVESTTALETTTFTTESDITLTTTTTETETVSSGTLTMTADTMMITETTTVSTTEYSCATTVFRRGLDAYAVGKTTSAPEPTSTPDESYDDCSEDEDEESSPAEYNNYSPKYMTVYPPSSPHGLVLTLDMYGQKSSSLAHPTASNYAMYPQASGNAPIAYQSGAIGFYSQSPSVSGRPQVSGNSTFYYSAGVTASSKISTPLLPSNSISSNSTIQPTAGPTASSVIFTTSSLITPTITPAPKPSCDAAPTALRTGFACDAISTACGCLGLAQATEDVTSTATFTETDTMTETMSVTTITTLTETVFNTVPATTETETPSATVTETAIATQTVCPCSGSASSLCGLTPDTCKDLQSDTSNCGSCGNTCGDGQTCSAGQCLTPAIPETPECASSRCGNFLRCGPGSSCYCVATSEGKGVCSTLRMSCSVPSCKISSDCAGDAVCALNTCCGHGICIQPSDVCPNAGSSKMMFRRRTWDGETAGGGA